MAAAQSGSQNTDLLKQPSPPNDGFQDDDNQDQIGSSTPSPSGIATPQPDPADRRLPSIMHNYFQVGSSSAVMLRSLKTRFSLSDPSPSSTDNVQPSALPDANGTHDDQTSGHSSSSSSSFVMVKRDEARSSSPDTPPPDKELDSQDISHESLPPTALPTPPCSSACSFLQKESEESEAEKGVGSIFTTLKNYLSPSRSVSCSDPKARRHTSHPVSSVSDDPVLASHFSNPSHSLSHASEALCLAEAPLLDHEKPHVSASSENQSKLTDHPSNSSQLKNTPPLTPRALSNDDLQAATMKKPAPPPSSNPIQSPPGELSDSADEITEKLNEVLPSAMETSSPSDEVAPVAPQKGKLHVKISRARGLQPGFDPYVVCVFEWNEVISKSVKDEEEESLKRQKKEFEQSSLDGGRPMAIPMNRQSSHNSALDNLEHRGQAPVTDPQWNHEAVFDVFGESSEVDVSVYDRKDSEAFLGHVRLCVNLKDDYSRLEGWFPLNGGAQGNAQVSGEIHLEMLFEKEDRKQVGPNDFQILKLIGKGTFGQVYQVKKKDTRRIYAMKVLSKKVIIQKKEVAHTVGERNILVRTAMAASPFIVGLKFSFQTPTDLYLVTDYMSGGELFWHLQKEGRFQEPRAKFYIAELILALQHLHDHDIVYRDLKPENILLDANGHIALCDFGLSKANLTQNDTTNTFCGTTEYLAPEVLLDEQGYTKMVDFWSLGVLVFEMCCGWSPFYADDTQQMYKNIAFGKVRFPRDALSTEGRNFVKGLLNRNPKHRLGAQEDAKELMEHPFFHDVDWKALGRKEVIPPFKPKLDSVTDTSNFDPEFTNALDNSNSLNLRAAALANGFMAASTPLSPGMQANFKGFTFVNESSIDHHLKPEGSDRMDEDYESWTRSHRSGKSIDQHMTGVQKNGDAGEIFNVDDNFDM